MEQYGPSKANTNPGSNPGVALFLALYLLLLAFFILLNSISTFEKLKAEKVMDSLTSTFASLLSPDAPDSFSGAIGDVVRARDFTEQVTKHFETAIQAVQVTILQPGELMQIDLHADSLFQDDSAEIRAGQEILLDNLVASVSGHPESLWYEMEFVIGTPYAVGVELPIGETLEMARAGSLARELIARGMPPRSLSMGMEYGNPKDVRIMFRVVDENAARLQFETEPQ